LRKLRSRNRFPRHSARCQCVSRFTGSTACPAWLLVWAMRARHASGGRSVGAGALRERERGHHERWGARKVYAAPEDHSQGFFLRDRRLLDALETGEPVVVRGHDLGGWDIRAVPLSPEQKDWPNWYTVTPDDHIVPAESPVVDPIRPPSQ
jgi:hypothetical protein